MMEKHYHIRGDAKTVGNSFFNGTAVLEKVKKEKVRKNTGPI